MKVLVCGGRDYRDREFLFAVLDHVHRRRAITLIIEGGARGADGLGREWAQARAIPFVTYPADWNRYGNRAGPVRNNQMLREGKPDMVAAFRGGVGTSHMVRISKEANVKVLETWKYE